MSRRPRTGRPRAARKFKILYYPLRRISVDSDCPTKFRYGNRIFVLKLERGANNWRTLAHLLLAHSPTLNNLDALLYARRQRLRLGRPAPDLPLMNPVDRSAVRPLVDAHRALRRRRAPVREQLELRLHRCEGAAGGGRVRVVCCGDRVRRQPLRATMRNGELLLQGTVRAFACRQHNAHTACISLAARRWLRYLCCNRQACAEFGFRRLLAAVPKYSKFLKFLLLLF